MTVVAMSGPDNVGKSTQVRLLARRAGMADLGALDAHDPRWAPARSAGLADWWFSSAPVGEVVDVLACSYLARAGSAGGGPGVRLADRGVPMLEATVAATAAVREHLGHEAAAGRAAELLAPYHRDLDRAEAAEAGVLLLHDGDPEAGAGRDPAVHGRRARAPGAPGRLRRWPGRPPGRPGRGADVAAGGDRQRRARQVPAGMVRPGRAGRGRAGAAARDPGSAGRPGRPSRRRQARLHRRVAGRVRGRALTPRLLHTLAMIGAGRQPVLWCAGDLRLPCPDAEADALASLCDGIAAVVEIRRQLLKPALDLRSLLKVTALAAKVALRAEGDEQPADADALLALIRRHPAAFPGLDATAVMAARHDEQAAARLAGAVLDWWLSTLPPAGPVP